MKSYKASGIVLHTIKYGDNSLIAYIFTDLFGRRSYLVRGVGSSGARRTRGNKLALLQPMSVIEFEGYENRHSELHGIREARNKLLFKSLPFDVRKSTIALFMAEVIYRLVREETANAALFEFMCTSVDMLDRADSSNGLVVANFHLWFLVRLSEYFGFYPGGEYSEGCVFDIAEGVFCDEIPLHGDYMSLFSAAILNKMMNSEGDQIGEIKITGERRAEFMSDLLKFFSFHFDMVHNINSLQILHEVFR